MAFGNIDAAACTTDVTRNLSGAERVVGAQDVDRIGAGMNPTGMFCARRAEIRFKGKSRELPSEKILM
jgi:hypothetical protein